MDLIFNNQIFSYDYTPSSLQVIERVKELLEDNNYYFNHFILDRTEKIEDPEDFLKKTLQFETVIEVIVTTAEEFVKNLLESTKSYIEDANPKIEVLVETFYSHPSPSAWEELSNLFEGVEWILSMVDAVDVSKYRPTNWQEVKQQIFKIKNELGSLEEALENNDTVLIADILKYELLPVFNSIKDQVKISLGNFGAHNDIR